MSHTRDRPPRRCRAAPTLALVAAVLLAAPAVGADDGNLSQRASMQQQQSRFERKLERLRAEARLRAGSARPGASAAPARPASSVAPRAHRSLRLTTRPLALAAPPADEAAEPAAAVELDLREQGAFAEQRHRALSSGIRSSAEPDYQRAADHRRQSERIRGRLEQRTLQRKLSR